MRKIKFLLRCAFGMNFGRMFGSVRKIAKENKKLSITILFDILWCGVRYGAGYVDYQIFDFVKLSGRQRKTFVTRGINNEFIRKLNDREHYFKFEDKSIFNTLFKEFIGRDWLVLKGCSANSASPASSANSASPAKREWFNELEALSRFVEKHPVIIVKPIDSICGKGIEKFEIKYESQVGGLYDGLVANKQLLVEEFIVQHDDVSALYSGSVNTVRFMTIACSDRVHVMFRALRVGIAGSVVDNFNAGGMFVLLNEDGVIVSDAVNKNTEIFERHPSTGAVFKGTVIPFFKEAEEMVREAARVVREIRYVSWDVAITPTGPVLVEGNHNPGYDLLQSKVWLVENEFGRLGDFIAVVGDG